MDTAAAGKIIEVLAKETSIYEDMLELSKSKTDIIVNGRVSELESITKLEQTMILSLRRLEDEREKLVEALAAELGIDSKDVTLGMLSDRLGEKQANVLGKYRKRLPAVLNELKEANSLNSKLIENSLDYINFSINVLSSVGPSDNNYINSGESITSKSRNFFDVKL